MDNHQEAAEQQELRQAILAWEKAGCKGPAPTRLGLRAHRTELHVETDPRKQTWCLPHWGRIRPLIDQHGIDPVKLSLRLVNAWEFRMREAKLWRPMLPFRNITRALTKEEYTKLRGDHSPLCCFAGDTVVAELFITEYARKHGHKPTAQDLGLEPWQGEVLDFTGEDGG